MVFAARRDLLSFLLLQGERQLSREAFPQELALPLEQQKNRRLLRCARKDSGSFIRSPSPVFT